MVHEVGEGMPLESLVGRRVRVGLDPREYDNPPPAVHGTIAYVFRLAFRGKVAWSFIVKLEAPIVLRSRVSRRNLDHVTMEFRTLACGFAFDEDGVLKALRCNTANPLELSRYPVIIHGIEDDSVAPDDPEAMLRTAGPGFCILVD